MVAATLLALSTAASAKDDFPPPPDLAAPPAGAQRTASGLVTRVLSRGEGKQHPRPDDTVEIHYTGWTADGRMFDSSVKREAPVRFNVSGVIKGWTEALQLMVVGESRRVWVPAELGYPEGGGEGRPSGKLVFDIELLGLTPAPRPPADVAAPPKNAKRTKSGLAYRVLSRGKGRQRAKPDNTVEINYTGWTPDGKMFETTVGRLEPPRFSVMAAMPGWVEGLQLMAIGDKFRFWVPGNLAYESTRDPGHPKGMVVFDVELLSIR